MSLTIESILGKCSGVEVRTTETKDWLHRVTSNSKYYKVGDIELPPESIYIEIKATAAKGTIARIASVEFETYGERYPEIESYAGSTRIVTYGNTIIYEVDGRKQQGRVNEQYVTILSGQHETKYVRDVKKHKKVVIKNPVNKYKQELQRGDWVIGVKRGNSLGIGRISRWTNSNLWAVTGDDLDDKSKEFRFASISETFTMPNDEHVKLLTMAVLSGWDGN